MTTEQFGYEESPDRLRSRLTANEKFGRFDINDSIFEIVKARSGEDILDLCCGMGKQTLPLANKARAGGHVYGLDISLDLLCEAKKQAVGCPNVIFIQHDCNVPLPFRANSFNLVTCCFGIYYINNLNHFLGEIDRVLRRPGRFFVMGPASRNNINLRELHGQISGKPEPEMIIRRRLRIERELLPLMNRHFTLVETKKCTNEILFTDLQTFVEYYAATLLLEETASTNSERQGLIEMMQIAVDEIIRRDGRFSIHKEYMAVLGWK